MIKGREKLNIATFIVIYKFRLNVHKTVLDLERGLKATKRYILLPLLSFKHFD